MGVMKNLRGKHALVTGAASGIGRATALALARQGAHVAILDRNEEGLNSLAQELLRYPIDTLLLPCDLTHPSDISSAVQDLLVQWEILDILINNAGVVYYGATDRMTMEEWHWLMQINLHAPIQLTQELLPTLLAQDEAHILNVSSIAGLVAHKNLAAYHTSKFGLVGFSESLRAEYANRNLGVSVLCPGLVRTPLHDNAVVRKRRKLPRPSWWLSASPETVAKHAIRAIRRNKGTVVVTPLARLLWMFKRFFPGLFDYVRSFSRKKLMGSIHSGSRQREDLPMQPAEVGTPEN